LADDQQRPRPPALRAGSMCWLKAMTAMRWPTAKRCTNVKSLYKSPKLCYTTLSRTSVRIRYPSARRQAFAGIGALIPPLPPVRAFVLCGKGACIVLHFNRPPLDHSPCLLSSITCDKRSDTSMEKARIP
jgi:hypothetical protein